jgi:hypothetical protein
VKNAERYVPEPIVRSCLVMPKGGAKGIFAGAVAEKAGSAARATSDMIAARQGTEAAPLEPGAASLGLLALTTDEIVLVNGRRGMLKPVATGLGGRKPRHALAGVELGNGKLTAPLRLSWTDGTTWEVDVPRGEAKRARALVEQLPASAAPTHSAES